MNRSPWTDEERALLKESYLAAGIEGALKALPQRSKRALYVQASLMKLCPDRRWSDSSIQTLRNLWGLETLPQIAKTLERTPLAVCLKASELGLKLGCPDGWAYITNEAKRTGFEIPTLKNVMEQAGMRVFQSYSMRKPGAKYRWCIVQPSDVDYAVTWWCTTETLHGAAVARGVAPDTLKRWLVAAGLTPPKKKRDIWRIPSKDIDEVIEKRTTAKQDKARVTVQLRVVAEKIKVPRQTLKSRLIALGIPHGRWGMRAVDVDKVVKDREQTLEKKASLAGVKVAYRRASEDLHRRWEEQRKRKAEVSAAWQRRQEEFRQKREAKAAATAAYKEARRIAGEARRKKRAEANAAWKRRLEEFRQRREAKVAAKEARRLAREEHRKQKNERPSMAAE